MAQNRLPDTLPKLISLGHDCADGAQQFEAAIPLLTNTQAALLGDVTDLETRRAAFAAFEMVMPGVPDPDTVVQVARSNAKAFLTLVRENLKPTLGGKGQPWTPLGWPATSLAIPGTSEKILPHLDAVQGFLTAHPEFEISTAVVVLTAAKALALWTALDNAVKARNRRDTDQATAFGLRNTSEAKLRTRLRGLIGELEQKIGPLDARWLAFGLNRPGAEDVPDAPANTHATGLGGGRVRVQCDHVPRADYFQFWIQVVGVDPEFRRAETFDEPDKILEALPVAATVKIKIRAVNEAGPGPFGDEMAVVVS